MGTSDANDTGRIMVDPGALWELLTASNAQWASTNAEDFIRALKEMRAAIVLAEDAAPEDIQTLRQLRAGSADALMRVLADMGAKIAMPTGAIWPKARREPEGGAQ